tara:strand:- start:1854 stop:2249 length:396 start_codon:yes stop_codon:yes gene_type:complete
MSKVGKAIYNILAGDSDVNSITTRISPLIIGQTLDLPAVVYSVTDTDPNDTKNGVSLLDKIGVEIDSIAEDYSTAEDLASKVRTALDRYSGTANGVKIQSVQFVNESDILEKVQNGLYTITQDYKFRVKLN